MANTVRSERHREQLRASTAARNAALRRLRDAHPRQFAKFYAEECAERGVTPRKVSRHG